MQINTCHAHLHPAARCACVHVWNLQLHQPRLPRHEHLQELHRGMHALNESVRSYKMPCSRWKSIALKAAGWRCDATIHIGGRHTSTATFWSQMMQGVCQHTSSCWTTPSPSGSASLIISSISAALSFSPMLLSTCRNSADEMVPAPLLSNTFHAAVGEHGRLSLHKPMRTGGLAGHCHGPG